MGEECALSPRVRPRYSVTTGNRKAHVTDSNSISFSIKDASSFMVDYSHSLFIQLLVVNSDEHFAMS